MKINVNGVQITLTKEQLEEVEKQDVLNRERQDKLIAKKCALMIEMHNFAYDVNEGWVADWEDMSFPKFGIGLSSGVARVTDLYNANGLCFGIAVKSKRLAQEMFEEFGDRVQEIYDIQY